MNSVQLINIYIYSKKISLFSRNTLKSVNGKISIYPPETRGFSPTYKSRILDSNSGSGREGVIFGPPPPLDGPEMKEMPYCRGRWDYRSGVLWQTLARLLESIPEIAQFW